MLLQWNLFVTRSLGPWKITLLYQVSHYIRVQKLRNIYSWDQQNYHRVADGVCYIKTWYNEFPLYVEEKMFCPARWTIHNYWSEHSPDKSTVLFTGAAKTFYIYCDVLYDMISCILPIDSLWFLDTQLVRSDYSESFQLLTVVQTELPWFRNLV